MVSFSALTCADWNIMFALLCERSCRVCQCNSNEIVPTREVFGWVREYWADVSWVPFLPNEVQGYRIDMPFGKACGLPRYYHECRNRIGESCGEGNQASPSILKVPHEIRHREHNGDLWRVLSGVERCLFGTQLEGRKTWEQKVGTRAEMADKGRTRATGMTSPQGWWCWMRTLQSD